MHGSVSLAAAAHCNHSPALLLLVLVLHDVSDFTLHLHQAMSSALHRCTGSVDHICTALAMLQVYTLPPIAINAFADPGGSVCPTQRSDCAL